MGCAMAVTLAGWVDPSGGDGVLTQHSKDEQRENRQQPHEWRIVDGLHPRKHEGRADEYRPPYAKKDVGHGIQRREWSQADGDDAREEHACDENAERLDRPVHLPPPLSDRPPPGCGPSPKLWHL